MAVSCMHNASGHNYRNSSFIVDVAMGQVPRSKESISSYYYYYRHYEALSNGYRVTPASVIWGNAENDCHLAWIPKPVIMAGVAVLKTIST